MLCAHTEKGDTICLPPYTREQLIQMRQQATFYCPECKEPLIVKVGKEITPHFAHPISSTCVGGGGEGEIHERGKWMLYTWLQEQFNDVQLEAFLPEIKQRPDILVTIGDQKIALEFQYSPISSTILRKRTSMYQSNKIFPIWILDIHHLQQRSTHRFIMNSFIKQCLFQPVHYSSPLIFFLCTEKKQLTLVHDVLFISLTTAFAHKTVYPLHRTLWKQLFQQKTVQNSALLTMWKADKRAFRMERRSAVGKQREWLYWLYERGLPIDYLPSVVHLPVKGQMFMRVQPWNWQSRLWYFLQNDINEKYPFTVRDCTDELASFMYPTNYFPLLQHTLSPIAAYIQWLVLLGYVDRLKNDTFQLRKPIHPLSHIEEAIKQDEQLMERVHVFSMKK